MISLKFILNTAYIIKPFYLRIEKHLMVSEEEYFEDLKKRWEKVWPHKSLPKELVYPLGKKTIVNYLHARSLSNPEKVLIFYRGKRFTYSQIDRLSTCFAHYLREEGVKKGDRVMLMLPNIPQFYIAQYGSYKNGSIVVLVNPKIGKEQLRYYLEKSSPKLLVTSSTSPFNDKEIGGNFSILVINPNELVEGGRSQFLEVLKKYETLPQLNYDVKLEDGATIMFTSGTTGLSKMVLHKHLDHVYTSSIIYTYYYSHLLPKDENVDYLKFLSKLMEDEVILAVTPIYWVAGNDLSVIYPPFSGASVALIEEWDVGEAIKAMKDYKVTTIYTSFDMFEQMSGSVRGIKLRLCIGTSFHRGLTIELRRKWEEETGCILREVAYGATEVHAFKTFTSGFHVEDIDIKLTELRGGAFCGIPAPETYIKVVNEAGEPLINEIGEIVIKSPSLSNGYFNDEESTRKSFRGGWFYTGDLGMYDENGFLYYMGRKKYAFKRGGKYVISNHLEFSLLKNKCVDKVAVIGEEHEGGESLAIAFVKLKEGCNERGEDIMSWCKQSFVECPDEILVINSMPLTPSGKAVKEELIKEYKRMKGKTSI